VNPYHVIVILAMGAVTYATRVGFFGLGDRFQLHPVLRRLLEYVPLSILAALVFPAVLTPSGELESPLTNIYLWAAVVTGVVLMVTRRPWAAIIVGVVSMVVLRQVV
jgi:branched-subunit amino acid transport protein